MPTVHVFSLTSCEEAQKLNKCTEKSTVPSLPSTILQSSFELSASERLPGTYVLSVHCGAHFIVFLVTSRVFFYAELTSFSKYVFVCLLYAERPSDSSL